MCFPSTLDLKYKRIDSDSLQYKELNNRLFSSTRDSSMQGEAEVLDLLIEYGVIKIDNYELCDINYEKSSHELKYEPNTFSAYPREHALHLLEKHIAYNFLKEKHKIEVNKDGFLFYIPELNLYLQSQNQTISEMIDLCSIKNANIGVLTAYEDKTISRTGCLRTYTKIALRTLTVNDYFFNIYNSDTNYMPKLNQYTMHMSFAKPYTDLVSRHQIAREYPTYLKQIEEDRVFWAETIVKQSKRNTVESGYFTRERDLMREIALDFAKKYSEHQEKEAIKKKLNYHYNKGPISLRWSRMNRLKDLFE